MDLKIVAQQAESIVRQAGQLLLSYYHQDLTHFTKQDGSFATQADLASEKFLLEHLSKLIPGAAVYAEESGRQQGNDYCWVIDPLDGTTNFSRKLPYFCVSVALTHHDQRLIGVVFNPLIDEMFVAISGHGAFLNGQRFTTPQEHKLARACIGFSLPYEQHGDLCKLVCQIEPRVYTCRVMGAAALDIAYCAAGRFDVVLFDGLFWWDMAAGSLLIEEAGGFVSELNGGSLSSSSRSFIGGSELIIKELKKADCCCSKD